MLIFFRAVSFFSAFALRSCNCSFLACRSGYDNVLLFQFLAPRLHELRERPRVLKRGNKISAILTSSGVEFRDVARLLAPSTSLRKFGELFNLEQAKAHFPFAYLTSVARLDDETLPYDDLSVWRSELSGEKLTDDQVTAIQEEARAMWNALHCKTVGDYLAGYLHLDVEILFRCAVLWNRSLKEAVGVSFVELGRFTISGLSYAAGIKVQEARLAVGSFFPNNSRMYAILRRGMRG